MHLLNPLPIFSLLAFLSAASTVSAQTLNTTGLPPCGLACRNANLCNTACSPDDVPCLCADYHFFLDVYACETTTCSGNDTLTAVNWARVGCGLPPVTSVKKSKRSSKFRA